MGQTAQVRSIDVLPLIASGLIKFRAQCASALDDMEIELRRVQEWIGNERKEYWVRELNRAYEKLNHARVALHQAKMTRKVAQHDPACIDEKRAVERAERRVRLAQEKIDAVRHWKRAIDRAVDDFVRRRTQFASWLETDLPRAVTALNQMSESLVTYISMGAPTDGAASETSGFVVPALAGNDGAPVETGTTNGAPAEAGTTSDRPAEAGTTNDQEAAP
jgi:hypothetical protein